MARYRLTESSQRNPQKETTDSYRAGWNKIFNFCDICGENIEANSAFYFVSGKGQICTSCYLIFQDTENIKV